MYEIEEHLAPLPGVGINSLSDESDSDDNSCVEITSTIDENENELIKWTNYLHLNSDDEDNDEDTPSTQSASLVSKKTTANIKQRNKSDVPQNNFECGSRTRMNY